MVTVQNIKEAWAEHLSESNRHDMQVQDDFYRSQERDHVIEHCRRIKMGLGNDDHPLSTAVLEHVISQLAVVYRSPPTRWWRDDRTAGSPRLADDAPAATVIDDAYETAHVDTFLREAERLTRLHRQTLIRAYASDTRRRVLLRAFTPLAYYRMPSPVDPSNLAEDQAVMLELADNVFEVWRRTNAGWSMQLLNEQNEPQGEALEQPYPLLPMVLMWDGEPSSAALPPRSARTPRLLKLSATENHLLGSMRSNVNGEQHFFQDSNADEEADPKQMPTRTGPNVRHLHEKAVERVETITTNPLLDQFLRVLERLEGSWLRAEGLPPDSFRQSQTVTALGLRVMAAPLQERQESLRQSAIETEQRLWEVFRAVHNAHAATWSADQLPEDVSLELELGPIDHPTDPRENVETLNLMLLGGGISQIEYLQRLHRMSRRQAIAKHAQNEADRSTYPARAIPRAGDVDPNPETLNPGASTAHAALAVGQE